MNNGGVSCKERSSCVSHHQTSHPTVHQACIDIRHGQKKIPRKMSQCHPVTSVPSPTLADSELTEEDSRETPSNCYERSYDRC